MAKISKGMILSQTSKIPSRSDYSFVLIEAKNDNEGLVKAASDAGLKVNALVKYSKGSQWDPKELTDLGFQAGCFLIVDLRGQMVKATDLLPSLALVRQYGYQAGAIDELSTLDDIKVLKANQIYLINSGKANDDQDASLNGDEITDGSGKLAVGMSVKWQRDYTNVDVSSDHAGFVGMGQDTLLKGGNAFGYSTNGRDFNAVITPKGLIFRRPDAERMWRLLKPNEIADINSTVGDKVKKEVDSATAEIPAAVSAANSAVSAAESAVAASKVNSDAIVAQSEAISEAKSAMDSATAEIQQLKANAASDVAQIRADVAQVQNEVDAAKAANSASVDKLKSDIGIAKKDLAAVSDSLTKAQAAVEQNRKALSDSVAAISSDIASTNDQLKAAQSAASDARAQLQSNVDTIKSSVDSNVASIASVSKQLDSAQASAATAHKALESDVAGIKTDVASNADQIKAAQAANDNTAKSLATYAQQAADQGKTIKTLEDAQNGFKETIADVQGNVSQVSDNVDKLQAGLTDTNKNVATVTAKADSLSATLTGQAKSIANITATATSLQATLKDAQGRISKVEQTAGEQSSLLSDLQGDLTKVSQKADSLSATLADAQKNITQIQADAKGAKEQITDLQGNVSTLQTSVSGMQATIASHDQTIHTLQVTASSLDSAIKDAKGNLSTLQQRADSLSTQLTNVAGQVNTVKATADSNTATISTINKNAMQDRGAVTDTKTSFDSLTQLGTYSIKAVGLPNMPEAHYGTLIVSGSTGSGWLSQQFVADNTGNVYTRIFANNAWSAWKQGGTQEAINQVKETADSNTATISNLRGTTNQLKQTLDSTTSTLTNAQKDISQLQQTANGFNSKLADHDKNIATLQADSKSLHSSMTDAQGRLSKVEQTAKEHTITISSLDDKLNNKDGINLQIGTGDFSMPFTANNGSIDVEKYDDHTKMIHNCGPSAGFYLGYGNGWFVPEVGETYTFSADIKGKGTISGDHFWYEGSDSHSMGTITLTDDWQRISNTVHIGKDSGTWIIYPSPDSSGVNDFYVKHIKIERGSVATPWTPAPEDLATVTQVKQTSDSITTTLKNVQGDVDQVTQKANGTSEQLADVKGNITNIQKDVSGLKQTTADNAGNIHTLQADSETLKDDVADAKGNISSLQKTSTSLVSEFKDHDGRLSKVEQTATEHTSELADTKGNIDEVTQKADSLEATLTDAQKDINSIKVDASGIHEALTGQGKQITTINATLDGLNTKYEGVSDDLSKLSGTVATNSTQIDQNKKSIALKADQATVDNLSGEVSRNTAQLKVQADQISSKVSSEDFSALDNKVGSAIAQIDKNTTAIDQTNKQISLKADQTEVDQVKQTATQNSSRLDVMAGQISSKVTSTDVNNIVDSKGYATTSTVQSLITQKAGTINESITNLTNEMNTRNGVNLLKGTKDFSGSWHNYGSTNYWHTENSIDPNGNHSVKSDSLSWYGYYQPIYLDTGDYTFSGYYYSEGGKPVYCYIIPNSGDNLVEVSYNSNLDSTPNGWRWFVVHFKVTKAGNAAVRLESSQNQVLHIASYKLERGTVTKPVWTPAPSDNATVTQVQQITASIDGLQSRVTNYQNDTSSKYTQLSDLVQSKVNQGDLNSVRTQLAGAINERVQKGELLSQINLTAGNTLIQSNKLYLDASSVVFSGRAFIPSAAITNIDADKITTGTLNGIDIHQIATKEGRSIDISGGNITLSSSDPYESRLSFKYQGQMVKMFNATGDLEADTWGIFNFSPSDTQNLHPIQFFRINNVGGKGSGSARMQLDHAIFDGHEWWANFDGITFGRSYDGINGSNDYVDLYAKSFLPHSQLSSKTRIEKLNGEDAMNMIKQVQMYTYQFKDDVRDGKTKRYASLIIDDVHDVAQYTEPDIFVADNKKCRDDGTQLAYAIAAIQYQQHEIEELKVQLKEKKANE